MNVVLDLDGTIVFPEPAQYAIPGRTRPTYISARSVDWLRTIGESSRLYIATARNARSVSQLLQLIPQVRFAGFVLECGLVSKTQLLNFGGSSSLPQPALVGSEADRSEQNRAGLLSHLQTRLSDWDHVPGYERMICCIAPDSVADPLVEVQRCAAELNLAASWHFHQERHKTFAYPAALCKPGGLKQLGVQRIDVAAGDDFLYDGSLLGQAIYPLTLSTADPNLIDLVRVRSGFVASGCGHAAAEELLAEISRTVCG